jgi:SAM-dependent methyltransferase
VESTWNEVYGKRLGGMWYPDEGLVRFVARYLSRRIGVDSYEKKRSTQRILDAGCGHGRHIVFLAEQHFNVYGIDQSTHALGMASSWLAKRGLKASLNVGDVTRLPFRDGTFDVVISYGVMDHLKPDQASDAIEEIRRILTDGGYLYVTLRSAEDCEYGRGKRVARNTFTLQTGYEKGLVQHFYNWEEASELLRRFKLFDVECHDERFPSSFGIDKAYQQSSKGVKGRIDLSSLDLDMKYSRWHIAAEKE